MYTFKQKQMNQLQRERVGIKKTAHCSQPMFAAMLIRSPVNELCLRMIYTWERQNAVIFCLHCQGQHDAIGKNIRSSTIICKYLFIVYICSLFYKAIGVSGCIRQMTGCYLILDLKGKGRKGSPQTLDVIQKFTGGTAESHKKPWPLQLVYRPRFETGTFPNTNQKENRFK